MKMNFSSIGSNKFNVFPRSGLRRSPNNVQYETALNKLVIENDAIKSSRLNCPTLFFTRQTLR